jgi:hypothetical protein
MLGEPDLRRLTTMVQCEMRVHAVLGKLIAHDTTSRAMQN